MKGMFLFLIVFFFVTADFVSPQNKERKKIAVVDNETPGRTRGPDPNRPSREPSGNQKNNPRIIIPTPVKQEPVRTEIIIDPGHNIPPDYCSVPIYEPVVVSAKIIQLPTKKEEGIQNLEEKNYCEAILNFSEAIEQNKKDLELYYMRGTAELECGIYEDAVEDFNYYLKFFEDDGEAYFKRGLAKFFLGDKEEAKKDMLSAAEYDCTKALYFIKKYLPD